MGAVSTNQASDQGEGLTMKLPVVWHMKHNVLSFPWYLHPLLCSLHIPKSLINNCLGLSVILSRSDVSILPLPLSSERGGWSRTTGSANKPASGASSPRLRHSMQSANGGREETKDLSDCFYFKVWFILSDHWLQLWFPCWGTWTGSWNPVIDLFIVQICCL